MRWNESGTASGPVSAWVGVPVQGPYWWLTEQLATYLRVGPYGQTGPGFPVARLWFDAIRPGWAVWAPAGGPACSIRVSSAWVHYCTGPGWVADEVLWGDPAAASGWPAWLCGQPGTNSLSPLRRWAQRAAMPVSRFRARARAVGCPAGPACAVRPSPQQWRASGSGGQQQRACTRQAVGSGSRGLAGLVVSHAAVCGPSAPGGCRQFGASRAPGAQVPKPPRCSPGAANRK